MEDTAPKRRREEEREEGNAKEEREGGDALKLTKRKKRRRGKRRRKEGDILTVNSGEGEGEGEGEASIDQRASRSLEGQTDSTETEKRVDHHMEGRPAPLRCSNVAQNGAVIVAPVLHNVTAAGDVNISVTLPPQKKEDTSQNPECSTTQQQNDLIQRVKNKHKDTLKETFTFVFEGNAEDEIPLERIYTPLYITEGESEGVNNEHEVRQIEYTSRSKTSPDIPINCNDIFKPLAGQEREEKRSVRTVMTKGIAGIGKTVSVQKVILDWAEGKANQDVDFIFVLPFRELNLIKDDQYSLHGLLKDFHPELSEIEDTKMYAACKVMFIFDGLDESRLQLDFPKSKRVTDVTKTSSVHVLLTNLIKGNLLPSSLVWVTSRPAAANQIPRRCINLMTEVRGFNNPQKEEYFRKRFSDDEDLANRIISHIKKTKSLYIICHIPVMCWINAKVLQHILSEFGIEEIPTTLTEMYTHFLLIQTKLANEKYQGQSEKNRQKILESKKDFILKLAQLAFEQLVNGNLIFYEEDLRKCGIDVSEAAVNCGLCTEFLKVDHLFYERKVYCFVHLSFQEFLAALYVFHCCVSKNSNVLESFLGNEFSYCSEEDQEDEPMETPWHECPLLELLKMLVCKALLSENGHLDLFLRFLLGLSLESNQTLLQGLLPTTENMSEIVEEMREYVRVPDVEEISPERYINLFLCLTEMKDSSVQEDIETFLQSGEELSSSQCSALAYAFMMSEVAVEELDLRKYKTFSAGALLIPAARNCKKAIMNAFHLHGENCKSLASVLELVDSHLRELHLSFGWQHDAGDELKIIFDALKEPDCKLKTLRLSYITLLHDCCESLASVLQSADSPLRELDLRGIKTKEDGWGSLFAALRGQHCQLETLSLSRCFLTEKCCGKLTSALRSNSHLTQLDLSHNDLQDSGMKMLSAGLMSPGCKLEILRLSFCKVTEEGCASLASALRSNSSHLRELDLSFNHPGDSGVKLLSDRLEDPHCSLQKLHVDHNEEFWVKPQLLKKYACDLTLDLNTAHRQVSLSEGNRRMERVKEKQPYPDHPDRFETEQQVLCREGLTGRHYWEVEWSGDRVQIGVTYKGISRKEESGVCKLGSFDKSWCLTFNDVLDNHITNEQNDVRVQIPINFTQPLPHSNQTHRTGVYLDWPAGTLSFYDVSSDTMNHLHTFNTTFAEPLYPAFGGLSMYTRVSLSLCQVEQQTEHVQGSPWKHTPHTPVQTV